MVEDKMATIIDEFFYRKSLLNGLNYQEAQARIVGFLEWLESTPETSTIISELRKEANGVTLLEKSGRRMPPKASTPEEIAAVALELMVKCKEGELPYHMRKYGIEPAYSTNSFQGYFDEVMRRYIWPFVEYVERELQKSLKEEETIALSSHRDRGVTDYPLEITESLLKFTKDHPHYERNAFIMMPFDAIKAHQGIVKEIRLTLEEYGVHGLRADDKYYHDDLFPNVLTYLWGCSIGIAVFERLEAEEFNPNVSLEVGYMRTLGKHICLLKDQTLKTLPTDLIGKLYTPFDPQDPEASIPESLEKWLRDKEIITL
jgi:hypothetical protein